MGLNRLPVRTDLVIFAIRNGELQVLLWRRRGLHELLWHRTRRLLFPFVLAVILVAPTVTWVSDRAIEAQLADAGDVNGAVYLGNESAVRAIVDAGLDPNAPGSDAPTPTCTSSSYSLRTLSSCFFIGSWRLSGNTVTRSLSPFALRTTICP